MADWTQPVQTTGYLQTLDNLKSRDIDAITLCLVDPASAPVGSFKWDRVNNKFQEYDGSSFVDKVLSLAGGGTGSATAAGARTNLGLGSMAIQNNNSVSITGGAIAEAAISDDGILARKADNETISGTWTFTPNTNFSANILQSKSGNNSINHSIVNTNIGNAAVAELYLGNSLNAIRGYLTLTGSGFTTTGQYIQDSLLIECNGVGGLSMSAITDMHFWTNNTHRMKIQSNGSIAIGLGSTSAPAASDLTLRSTANGLLAGIRVDRGGVNNDYLILNIENSGTGALIQAGNTSANLPVRINSAGGEVFLATNIYKFDGTAISPDAADNTYDLGTSSRRFRNSYVRTSLASPGAISSIGGFAFIGDTDTGLQSSGADTLELMCGNTQIINLSTSVIALDKRTTVNGNHLPVTDNTYSSGELANRWTAVYAVNGTIQTSDERMKKDIRLTSYGLDFVNKLRPVEYRWKHDGARHLGFIAQDLLKLDPNFPAVNQEAPALLSMSYTEMIPVLAKAIQELDKKVNGVLNHSA